MLLNYLVYLLTIDIDLKNEWRVYIEQNRGDIMIHKKYILFIPSWLFLPP
ncbi:hypothetical protein J26TS2_41720 [Shouchella clausii]|nr:hypothetical protein J26TS2_41720 [Shouchella clausii]